MEFKTIEAPRDNGNHALTQHCGAFACVFCGAVCTGIRTVVIASSRCNARAKKYIALDGETMDALRYAWNETFDWGYSESGRIVIDIAEERREIFESLAYDDTNGPERTQ